MADSTWAERELPVLEAVRAAEAAEESGSSRRRGIADRKVAELADMQLEAVRTSLYSLCDADPPYVKGEVRVSPHGGFQMTDIRLTERGRRMVGQWPAEQSTETERPNLGNGSVYPPGAP